MSNRASAGGSTMDKAEPISNGGSASGITCLGRGEGPQAGAGEECEDPPLRRKEQQGQHGLH